MLLHVQICVMNIFNGISLSLSLVQTENNIAKNVGFFFPFSYGIPCSCMHLKFMPIYVSMFIWWPILSRREAVGIEASTRQLAPLSISFNS